MELNASTLSRLPPEVARPNYDRRTLTAGIVHFGVGGFHRSHQAMFLDGLMNQGEALDWAVCRPGTSSADLPGARSRLGLDLDGDGNMDIVAVSVYAIWSRSNPMVASLSWFRNDGPMNFIPPIPAYSPLGLIAPGAADLDGKGRPVLITGGPCVCPPSVRMSRIAIGRHPPSP